MASKRKPIKYVLPALLFLLILVALCATRRPNTEFPRDKLYQLVPWVWSTRVENHDLQSLSSERACADGSIDRHNAPTVTPEIPRTVHFTWGLKGDGAFTFALYLAIRAAQASIRPAALKIHYTRLDRDNRWFQALAPNLTLVYHDPAEYLDAAGFGAQGSSRQWHVAHVADVLRLQILRDEGGIYLDSDAYALQPLDGVLRGARDVVMAHEGGNRYGMANAVVVAKKGAPFVERWLGEYATFDEQDWNWHSVVLPKRLADQHPLEICALSPTAFFWPLWTESHVEYMHVRLTDDEADEVKARVERYGGALYADQLVYHAWSHNSFQRFIERLTPEIVRTEDTRFNILMRRFLPPDE
ncbi:MAG: hypothetical protein LQ340_002955 [Diploschistes diacapsis]|nr:MAG: hypothetical protein LQ340_002955 [Diploschistes diacapsis]